MANETEYQSCPICSAAITRWRTRTTRHGSYPIDVCRSCGFAFVNPRPSLSYLMDYYSFLGFGGERANEAVPTMESVVAREAEDPNSTIDARRLVATTADLLGPLAGRQGTFLDIGCGYGFFSREAVDRGFKVTALDLATNKRKVMKEITGLDPVASSFEDFDGPPASFSAVLMSQILEHVLDINLWIAKANRILESGGMLTVALPNFNNAFRYVLREKSPYIIPPEHLNFFSPNSLSRLLENHGFKVERIQWVSLVPKWILKRRLPKGLTPMWPVVNVMAGAAFGMMDALHLGLMINIYGRKIRQSPQEPPASAGARGMADATASGVAR